MKRLLFSVVAMALLTMTSGRALATVVVSDNFDSYANQAAFEAVWTPIGTVAPISAVLSTAQSVSAPNSVQVPGYTTASGSYRNRQSFAETGNVAAGGPSLEFSFDFYDVGTTASPSPQRNYVNLQDTTAPGATNQLVSLGMNNNQTSTQSGGNYYMARILGYTNPTTDPDGGPAESVTGAAIYFKLNDFGVGLRSATAAWVNLKVVLSTDDGASVDYAFYVNNVLAEKVSNVGTAASIRSYDNIVLGSGLSNGGTQTFFDNVLLETVAAVPEASSFFAVGLVGLGLAASAWKRNKPAAA